MHIEWEPMHIVGYQPVLAIGLQISEVSSLENSIRAILDINILI